MATTMAGVAERAGVARQTVYLMFASKQSLQDTCIDERIDLVLGRSAPEDVVDVVWTMASRDVWLKLVEEKGWTSARWQRRFIGAMQAAIATSDAR